MTKPLLAFGKSASSLAMHNGRHHRHRQLDTFDEVVEALGGLREVGRICDNQDTAAVCNWKRRRERFPTKYYKVMIAELNARGASAPDHLWGFAEAR